MPSIDALAGCKPPFTKNGPNLYRAFTAAVDGVSFSECHITVNPSRGNWDEFHVKFDLGGTGRVFFWYDPDGTPQADKNTKPAAAAEMLGESANGPKFQKISAKAAAVKTAFVNEWQQAERSGSSSGGFAKSTHTTRPDAPVNPARKNMSRW